MNINVTNLYGTYDEIICELKKEIVIRVLQEVGLTSNQVKAYLRKQQ